MVMILSLNENKKTESIKDNFFFDAGCFLATVHAFWALLSRVNKIHYSKTLLYSLMLDELFSTYGYD